MVCFPALFSPSHRTFLSCFEDKFLSVQPYAQKMAPQHELVHKGRKCYIGLRKHKVLNLTPFQLFHVNSVEGVLLWTAVNCRVMRNKGENPSRKGGSERGRRELSTGGGVGGIPPENF
jgi:hypothetical protein